MIHFPAVELMDERKCYDYWIEILHPDGLCYPECKTAVGQSKLHRRDRALVCYFRCACGRIDNPLAGTLWPGTHHGCGVIVHILKGFAQGVPTLHLERELGIDRQHLLKCPHNMQALATWACVREPLADDACIGKIEDSGLHPHLEPSVLWATQTGATVNTDEWGAYHRLSGARRQQVTVCHESGQREWARDDDGDRIREVHVNTSEGL